jgi:hypothetical protein
MDTALAGLARGEVPPPDALGSFADIQAAVGFPVRLCVVAAVIASIIMCIQQLHAAPFAPQCCCEPQQAIPHCVAPPPCSLRCRLRC